MTMTWNKKAAAIPVAGPGPTSASAAPSGRYPQARPSVTVPGKRLPAFAAQPLTMRGGQYRGGYSGSRPRTCRALR